MMSHRLDDIEFMYLSSCVCALSTFATDSFTFSSIRTASSPCSDTIVASCWKIPPSSVMVRSTFCSASDLALRYWSCPCTSS